MNFLDDDGLFGNDYTRIIYVYKILYKLRDFIIEQILYI